MVIALSSTQCGAVALLLLERRLISARFIFKPNARGLSNCSDSLHNYDNNIIYKELYTVSTDFSTGTDLRRFVYFHVIHDTRCLVPQRDHQNNRNIIINIIHTFLHRLEVLHVNPTLWCGNAGCVFGDFKNGGSKRRCAWMTDRIASREYEEMRFCADEKNEEKNIKKLLHFSETCGILFKL